MSAYASPTPKFPLPGVTHAPTGTAAETQTVSSGVAPFVALADGTRYVAVGLVGGEYRRVYFKTTETNTGLAGVPQPSWMSRRLGLGLSQA